MTTACTYINEEEHKLVVLAFTKTLVVAWYTALPITEYISFNALLNCSDLVVAVLLNERTGTLIILILPTPPSHIKIFSLTLFKEVVCLYHWYYNSSVDIKLYKGSKFTKIVFDAISIGNRLPIIYLGGKLFNNCREKIHYLTIL